MKRAGLIAIAIVTFAVPLSAQEPAFGNFTIGVGVVTPFRKLADVAGTGVGVSAVSTIPVGPFPASVRLVAAYNRFGFADKQFPVGAGSTGDRQNPAYVELTAGMQFESLSESPVVPYANVGWGFFLGQGSVPSRLAGGDHKSSHIGGSVGGGIKFRAIARDLVLEARYVTISGGDQYLPVTLGISF